MPRGPMQVEKIWFKLAILPGFMVHINLNPGFSSIQKNIIYIKKANPQEKIGPYLSLKHFMIVRVTDFDKLKNLGKELDFNLATSDTLLPKDEARLLKQLTIKKPNEDGIKAMLKEVRCLPWYQDNQEAAEAVRQKIAAGKREKKEKRKENNKDHIAFKDMPMPFHYLGNSRNYLEGIMRILKSSAIFQKAEVVLDVTCGSCSPLFYLAKQFPQKQFIGKDINPDVIHMLNYGTVNKV